MQNPFFACAIKCQILTVAHIQEDCCRFIISIWFSAHWSLWASKTNTSYCSLILKNIIRCNDLFVFDGFVSLPGEKADATLD